MAKTSSRGLESSAWASSAHRTQSLPPRTPSSATPPSRDAASLASASPQAQALARAQALKRFEQTCGRLRWKSIDLENAYNRANAPEAWAFAAADAERNFKVDFHEFYVWIEQAVVLLLKVFGTSVERGVGAAGNGTTTAASQHAYHHNVLRALDDAAHPLHGALGQGDVNHALWKAKELRNRWKDAAEGRETPPLKMYDLNWIVTEAMRGLEAAYDVASARVRDDLAAAHVEASVVRQQQAAQDEWEWMVEPMDWEA
ncbi:fungal specific transcription factor [Hirsutella rhossiliensis]|uniref:Fungal specific transcription factor n=1 Tax=Hirsutella rhossiliensis TaxID=111463 RepID=A0A9P8MZ45_9HYPO|nr:fungal specific transcription factor [Hirsutella rhossiliensis]KAH0964693.1 fungal specific transcription factor [Hirsutella rhossiliensis]